MKNQTRRSKLAHLERLTVAMLAAGIGDRSTAPGTTVADDGEGLGMFDVRTWADVRADVGGINGPDELAARSPLFPVVLTSTGIANGGTDTQSQKIPNGFVFAAFAITGVLMLNASGGSAVDGAILPNDGGPTLASNTMYSPALFTVTLAGSTNNLNGTPIPWPALVGDARNPFILPCPHYVNGGDDMRAVFSNATGIAVDVTLVIWGRKIRVG